LQCNATTMKFNGCQPGTVTWHESGAGESHTLI
jgi:hypothetical protein